MARPPCFRCHAFICSISQCAFDLPLYKFQYCRFSVLNFQLDGYFPSLIAHHSGRLYPEHFGVTSQDPRRATSSTDLARFKHHALRGGYDTSLSLSTLPASPYALAFLHHWNSPATISLSSRTNTSCLDFHLPHRT